MHISFENLNKNFYFKFSQQINKLIFIFWTAQTFQSENLHRNIQIW